MSSSLAEKILPSAMTLRPAKLTLEEQREVEQFLFHEARLLDDGLRRRCAGDEEEERQKSTHLRSL